MVFGNILLVRHSIGSSFYNKASLRMFFINKFVNQQCGYIPLANISECRLIIVIEAKS